VMSKRGIDISQNRTKHLDEFVSQPFDLVITLCDRVREVCPEFPSHPDLVHWSMADPAVEDPAVKDPAVKDPAMDGHSRRSSLPAFERTAVELERRITFLLQTPNQPPTRRSTHAR
jgi:ArsR family transcriptional regulator, arsenate/arsenite/antimonite-responsive transcriptional repressor / arsenate reductase (thioredoxin)